MQKLFSSRHDEWFLLAHLSFSLSLRGTTPRVTNARLLVLQPVGTWHRAHGFRHSDGSPPPIGGSLHVDGLLTKSVSARPSLILCTLLKVSI